MERGSLKSRARVADNNGAAAHIVRSLSDCNAGMTKSKDKSLLAKQSSLKGCNTVLQCKCTTHCTVVTPAVLCAQREDEITCFPSFKSVI